MNKLIKKTQMQTLPFFVLFKCSVDIGFYYILSKDISTYTNDFNVVKYINGTFWCILLFLLIRFDKRSVSAFFLLFKLMLEIVPITTIYAISNENALYYNAVALAFGLCEILVGWLPAIKRYRKISSTNFIFIFGLTFCTLLITLYIFIKGGVPSFKAFNIYKVYEIRKSNKITLNNYLNYFFQWMMWVIIPFWLSRYIFFKKYFKSLILTLIVICFYLYFGHKTFLFSLPLIIICTVWSKRKYFCEEFSIIFALGHFILVFLSSYTNFFYQIYSLIGRRVMIVSANNKFKYFDFFSQNKKMGLAGVFPRWLINIENPYPEGIGHIIAERYYNSPEMNSNTGFLAEGYMRFGIWGIFFTLIMFSLLLRLMDLYQKETNYPIAIGTCIYLIFDISDGHIIDSLFMGPWMILLIILIIYSKGIVTIGHNNKLFSIKT